MKRSFSLLQKRVCKSVVGLVLSLSMISTMSIGDFIFVQKDNCAYAAEANNTDAVPKGIAVTYYDGIYSRGFAWSTDEHSSESYLYYVKASSGMTKDKVDWDKATKLKATMVKRTDLDGKEWHVFKAHVRDLSKGKTYFYKVGNEETGFSDVGTVNVEKKEEDITGTTFLHLTDCQESKKDKYDRWAEVLKYGMKKFPESKFVAFSGDLTNDSYESLNMNQWIWGLDQPKETLLNLPISPASGNHDRFDYSFTDRFDFKYADYVSDSDEELKLGGCYYYKYGKDILFITLNTNESSGSGFNKQENWVRDILKKNKDCKWKIVQIHKGVMSTGDHTNSSDVKQFREKLPKIFAEYKVDLVLQGHDHVYTRTKPYMYGVKEDGKNYIGHTVIDEPGVITKKYEFDGEKRLWNLEPEGTHYVTINYCANKDYEVLDYDSVIKPGINPVSSSNGCSVQPHLPMYGVVKIRGGVLCYDAYTFNRDTKESKLYDTFSVDKRTKEELEDKQTETDKPENTEKENNNAETSKPGTDKPENAETETDKPETNKPDNTEKENNNTETSKPGTDKPEGTEIENDESKKDDDLDSFEKKNNQIENEKHNSEFDKSANKDVKKHIEKTSKVESKTGVSKVYKKKATSIFKKNLVFKDKKTKAKYKIIKLKYKNGKVAGGKVIYLKPIKKKYRKLKIFKTVKYHGVKFKVTKISKKAFAGCKKLKVVIVKSKKIKIKSLKKKYKKIKFKVK